MKKHLLSLLVAALMVPLGAWAQIELPYSNGFETAGDLTGWTATSNNSVNQGEFGRSTDAARTGSYGFRFSSYEEAYDYSQYLITPEIDFDGSILLSFWCASYSSYSPETFAVGYSTTNAQVGSFTWLEDYDAPTVWTEYTAVIPSGAKYVAIHYKSDYAYYLYVDDFTMVDAANYCAAPVSLTATDQQENSISISWANGGVGDDTYYSIRYYKAIGADGDTTEVDNVSDLTYTANDLEANTAYTFEVVAHCSSESFSTPATATFRTACGTLVLPYSEGFENGGEACWSMTNYYSNGSSYTGPSTVYALGGTRSYRLYCGTRPAPIFLVMPYVDDLSSLMLGFNYRGSTYVSFEVGTMTSPTDTASFTALHQYNVADGNSWFDDEVTFATAGEDAHYIAFRAYASYSGYSLYLDDVELGEAPSCARPTAIAVTNPTETSATLTITDPTNGGAYHVVVMQEGTTVVFDDVIGETEYEISNLVASTAYTVSVSADCGDGTETSVRTASFRTACGTLVLPYSEGFENGGEACWSMTNYYSYGSSYTGPSTDYALGGTRSYRLYCGTRSAPTFLVMPYVDDLSSLMLGFNYRGSTYVSFEVGTMTSPTDTASFTALHQYNDANGYSWFDDEVTFATAGEDAHYIAFRAYASYSGYSLYLDDVELGEAPSCARPTAIAVTNPTETSATLTITDPAEGGSYHVVVKQDTTVVIDQLISETEYELTSLVSSTGYTVSVSTDCGDGSESSARTMGFRTACGDIAVFPWAESFDDAGAAACWTVLDYDYNASDNWSFDDGQYMIAAYNDQSAANDWLVSPTIVLPEDGEGLTLKFRAKGSSYQGYATHLTVRLSTSGTDTASFTQTLFSQDLSEYWDTYSASVDAYAGETIYIAFIHDSYNDNGPSLDDVQIVATLLPVVGLNGPATVSLNEEKVFVAQLIEGSSNDMVYTWSSTMATAGDATMTAADDTLRITYTATGVDTLRLHVMNQHGADSAMMVVNVIDLSPITEFPYSTGFEAGDDRGWFATNGTTNGWYLGSATFAGSGSEGHSVYMSSSQGTNYGYTPAVASVSYIARRFSFAAGEYEYSYDWKGYGDSRYHFLRAFILPDAATLVADQNYGDFDHSYLPTDAIAMDEGYMSGQDTWTTATGSFVVSTADIYQVVFVWVNDDYNSNASTPGAIDNVSIAPLTCSRPAGVSMSGITATAATLTINDASESEHYMVYYTTGNVTDSVELNASTYSFDNLSVNTKYTVRVVRLCDDLSRSSATTITFSTACEAVTELPWSEDFSASTVATQPDCWSFVTTGTTTEANPQVRSDDTYLGSMPDGNFLRIRSGDDYGQNIAVLPLFDADVNTLQVSFGYKFEDEGEGIFEVGYIAGDVASTFEVVETLTPSEAYTTATVSFAATTGAERIAFRYHGVGSTFYTVGIDNVVVSVDGSTPQPVGIDAAATSAVRLYPNPATSSVSVEFEGVATVSLLDLSGRQVMVTEADSRATFDVSSQAKGAYFVRVTSAAGTAVSKLVVK